MANSLRPRIGSDQRAVTKIFSSLRSDQIEANIAPRCVLNLFGCIEGIMRNWPSFEEDICNVDRFCFGDYIASERCTREIMPLLESQWTYYHSLTIITEAHPHNARPAQSMTSEIAPQFVRGLRGTDRVQGHVVTHVLAHSQRCAGVCGREPGRGTRGGERMAASHLSESELFRLAVSGLKWPPIANPEDAVNLLVAKTDFWTPYM
jgi:hypothetical protein